jgi:murein L,D-transpeptidase YcbB/YkuD
MLMARIRNHLVYLALSALLWASLTTRGSLAVVARPIRPSRRGSQPVPQPLSTAGKGLLRTLLQAGALSELRWPDFGDYRAHVAKFYETNDFALRWVREMQATQQAQDVIALFRQAEQKGLSAEDYDGPRWGARLAKLKPATQQPDEQDVVRFDVALTVCLMRYISDLHIGKVNPQRFHFQIDVTQRKYDLPEFLQEHAVNAADVSGALAQVEPPYPGYQRTIRALNTYLELAREDDGDTLPEIKKPVQPGEAYPGVPRLARFLHRVGDLPADTAVDSTRGVYDGALVDAVKSFQQRHGLAADGRIDARTLDELNVPLNRRVRQMQLTLERWRWMPNEYQHAPIVANIPEFRLRAYDQQFRIGTTMNVVVGQAYRHDTPVFVGSMRYVIFRPYWEVPPSIAAREILPAIGRNPAYLTNENLELVDSRQNPAVSQLITPDVLEEIRRGQVFLRQRPGPKNSLGLVKFMFPNEFDVYMHDTPATELFEKSRRDFSHGCIRLEKPADLAAWVLRDNPGWTPERIRAAMNGDKTEQVNLTHPIPVLILYATVNVSEDGVVHFYNDIYGHDATLEKALAHGYPYPS